MTGCQIRNYTEIGHLDIHELIGFLAHKINKFTLKSHGWLGPGFWNLRPGQKPFQATIHGLAWSGWLLAFKPGWNITNFK